MSWIRDMLLHNSYAIVDTPSLSHLYWQPVVSGCTCPWSCTWVVVTTSCWGWAGLGVVSTWSLVLVHLVS